MKNSKTRIMFIMCISMAIMAIGYAYFATNLDITATGNITTNWNVKFTSITQGSNGGTGGSNAITPTFTDTTATMGANLKVPGDYMEYDLVLRNSGSINAIIESINANATGSPAIIYSISGLNKGDKLAGGAQKTIKIRIEYDTNTSSQPINTTKTLTVSIKAVQDTGQTIINQSPSINQPTYLSGSILRNNVAYADTDIDFKYSSEGCYSDSNQGIVCNENLAVTNGLYYTNTNTENNETTYYFRGAVENNYVQFGEYNSEIYYGYYDSSDLTYYMVFDSLESCQSAEEYNVNCTKIKSFGDPIVWRIIRINEDGSIRLITQNSIGTSSYNFSGYNDDNMQVGYMYGIPGSSSYAATHANTNNSKIKTFLDTWYVNNLSRYSSYLADAGFCNDRSVAPRAGLWDPNDTALGYANNFTLYGAVERLVDNINVMNPKDNAQPQFACPNEESDLFTMNTSTKGNKKLTNPIGLITVDEVAYAGGSANIYNESIYLNGARTLIMSPNYFQDSYAYVWNMYSDGLMGSFNVNGDFDVRPVVNLKSTVELSTNLLEGCTKLDGTSACPYIIKTN